MYVDPPAAEDHMCREVHLIETAAERILNEIPTNGPARVFELAYLYGVGNRWIWNGPRIGAAGSGG